MVNQYYSKADILHTKLKLKKNKPPNVRETAAGISTSTINLIVRKKQFGHFDKCEQYQAQLLFSRTFFKQSFS